MNRAIITALVTIGTAQLLKIPLKKRQTGVWEWSTFFETGGMPSSHSAGVSALATFVGLKRGMPTIVFALASIFGLLVMYDAQGIRRQAGELSIKVNDLDEDIETLMNEHPGAFHDIKEERLKERLGHQPEEVLIGACYGFATGALSYLMDKKSLG